MSAFPAELGAAIDAATPLPAMRRGLRALALTEAGGRWRWEVNGKFRPPIAPEPHVFHRLLSGDKRKRAVALGLAHPKWGGVRVPSSYSGRYDFLDRMRAIDAEAADGATSWGWGQVMGYHGPALGFECAQHLAQECETAEGATRAVLAYLKRARATADLADLPDRRAAERLAKKFNGPAWRRNRYADRTIANWHLAGGDASVPAGRSVADLQRALRDLGRDPGRIDGVHGPQTNDALRDFQNDRGIAADGDPGPMTWDELDAAAAEQAAARKTATTRKTAAGGAAAAVATPAIADMIREADGVAGAARSIADAMGLAGPLLMLGVAGAVGFAVWRILR